VGGGYYQIHAVWQRPDGVWERFKCLASHDDDVKFPDGCGGRHGFKKGHVCLYLPRKRVIDADAVG
jgi:hypothetical protein